VRSLRRSPAKHIELLPQDQVFRFQRCSRLEARGQDTEYQLEQIGHQDASLRRPPAASTPNRIFGTHNTIVLAISLFLGMVVGGVGWLPGSIVGSAFIIFVPNIAEGISKGLSGAVFGVLLFLVIFLVPHGARKVASQIELLVRAFRRP
jgi:hypothetical protein